MTNPLFPERRLAGRRSPEKTIGGAEGSDAGGISERVARKPLAHWRIGMSWRAGRRKAAAGPSQGPIRRSGLDPILPPLQAVSGTLAVVRSLHPA